MPKFKLGLKANNMVPMVHILHLAITGVTIFSPLAVSSLCNNVKIPPSPRVNMLSALCENYCVCSSPVLPGLLVFCPL